MRYLLPLFLLTFESCGTAPIRTTDELAVYTECNPEKIAYWISNSIEYQDQGDYWIPTKTSMALRKGDCKAMASIAKATLNRCNGYSARIQVLKNGDKVHAVAVFTNHKGERGFIDGGNWRLFEHGTKWKDIIAAVPGGPWEER